MGGADILQLEVPDARHDLLQMLLVTVHGLCLEVKPRVISEEDLAEGIKANIPVCGAFPVLHGFLKKNRLPLKLLFGLARRHSRVWHPGHVLPDLLPVQTISAGDRDLITPALLFDGGHSIVNPPFPLAPWPPMCYYKWVDYGLG